jgi:hypothetical protein
MLTGYTANLPNDIVLDSGVAYVGSAVLGATRGSWEFDPAWTIENVDFDGKHPPIKLLDRKFHGEALFSATLIEFGPSTSGNQIAKLEAGSASVDTGTTPSTLTTITPKAGGGLYAAGDYLTDVRIMFERAITAGAGVKKYAAIYFPSAIVRKWGPLKGENKKEASFAIEICGRKDMAAGTTADATYKIELREALP